MVLSTDSCQQMQSLLQKLNTDIVEVIQNDHNSKVNDENQDEGNHSDLNYDSVMQQLQSDPNEDDMEDVVLNDHDMLSNKVLLIE